MLNNPTTIIYWIDQCLHFQAWILTYNVKQSFLQSLLIIFSVGTDVDAKMAEDLFTELGFSVKRKDNLRVYEMRSLLYDASIRDYSNLSAFVCIILSHGQEGLLYGIDDTVQIRELTGMFRKPNLAGKPKVFLFQACQGKKVLSLG